MSTQEIEAANEKRLQGVAGGRRRPRGRVYTKQSYILILEVSPLQEDATGTSTNYYHSGIC